MSSRGRRPAGSRIAKDPEEHACLNFHVAPLPARFLWASSGEPPRGDLIGGALAPALAATQDTAQTPVSVTPLAQIRIGRFTVTALTDGYADMPYDYFPGRAAAEVEQAAIAQFTARPSGVRFLFNQYLVDDGERRILIDAGPAGSIGQTGELPQALSALGLQRDQIDAVIVTHMHQDHMGGLIVGGKNNYPKAELYIDRRDVTHWTDPAKRSGAPDYLQTSFQMAGRSCASIRNSRRLTASVRLCGASPLSTLPAIHPAISACGSKMAGRASSWFRI